MRYFVYIDKELVKNLIASYSELDFSIDFIEYSIQKSCSNVNNIRTDPRKEIIIDEKSKTQRDSKSISVDMGISSNTTTERRYINISDVTDIKNISFYNNLIDRLKEMSQGENRAQNRIIEQQGSIRKVRLSRDDTNNNLFLINNNYVWCDNKNSQTDMDFFTNMCGEVKVIGYNINENKTRNVNVLKAIAIYIE